jgi:hypothetical protein
LGDVGLVVLGQRAPDDLGRQDAPAPEGQKSATLKIRKKGSRWNLFPHVQSIFFELETMEEPMNRSKSTTCLSLLFLTGLTITAFVVWITFDCPPAGAIADELVTQEECISPDALATLWCCRSVGGTEASDLLEPERKPSTCCPELPAPRLFLADLLRSHPPNGPPQHPFFGS